MNEEESHARRKGHSVRDALVFLIDWRHPMTRRDASLDTNAMSDNEDESPQQRQRFTILSLCLRAVIDLMRDKIRRRVSDAVAVITYGGHGKPIRPTWPGIRVLRPLVSCDAAGIQKLETLVHILEQADSHGGNHDDSNNNEDAKFGLEDDDETNSHFDKAMGAVLNQFTAFFTALAKNTRIVHRKRVVVLTCDDDPTKNLPHAVRAKAFTYARDLAEINVTIHVKLLTTPGCVMVSDSVLMAGDTERVDDGDDDGDDGTSAKLATNNIPQPKRFFQPLVACTVRAQGQKQKQLGSADCDGNADDNNSDDENDNINSSNNNNNNTGGATQVELNVEIESRDVDVDILVMCDDAVDDLRAKFEQSDDPKRAIRRTQLILSPSLASLSSSLPSCSPSTWCTHTLGVAVYAPIRKARRPTKAHLVADTNREVKKITTRVCASVGGTLRATDIRHMFQPDFVKEEMKRQCELNAGNIAPVIHGFSRADMIGVKSIDAQQGLVLYGFRRRQTDFMNMHLGKASFVVGDDSKLAGSEKLFGVLLKSMLKMGVVALVSVKWARTGVRFGMLVPQDEEYEPLDSDDEGGDDQGESNSNNDNTADSNKHRRLRKPGGMHLCLLPFKDDVYTQWRKELYCACDPKKQQNNNKHSAENAGEEDDDVGLNCNNSPSPSPSHYKPIRLNDAETSTSLARRFARHLRLPSFDPKQYVNPDLDAFYDALEQTAGLSSTMRLSSPLSSSMLDPDEKQMRERAGKLMQDFQRCEAGDDFDGEEIAKRFATKTGLRAAEVEKRREVKEREKDLKRQQALQECDVGRFERVYITGGNKGRGLEEFTVKQLKVYCRAHGLPETGNKRNLVVAIEDDLEARLRKRRRKNKERHAERSRLEATRGRSRDEGDDADADADDDDEGGELENADHYQDQTDGQDQDQDMDEAE